MSVGRRLRRGRDDRGAVGVTFAILLASGVLLGALAMVVDVGRIYVERDDLQNGADAAALALARACAEGAPECDSELALLALAQDYADANAADGTSAVGEICGDLPGVLPPCGDQPENLTRCLGEPPLARYVEVHLRTRMADGSTVLPPRFAQAVAGGTDAVEVGACARATWGDISVLALTINECIYNDAPQVAEGEPFSRWDEYPIQFWFWDSPPCVEGSVARTPDIAGLLDGADADCEIGMSDDGVIGGQFIHDVEYGRASDPCRDRIRDAWLSGETIYLPVYDTRTPDPTSPAFHHVFVAPFVVTAYQLGIPPVPVFPPPEYDPNEYREGSAVSGSFFWSDPCGTDELGFRCLTGVFTGAPIPIEQLTGDDRIRLVG